MNDIDKIQKEWYNGIRTVVECHKCGDKIHSHYSGALISCECDNIFVDETDCYVRIGGPAGDMTVTREKLYEEKV